MRLNLLNPFKMKKFEYCIATINSYAHGSSPTDMLNGLGSYGWELVAVSGNFGYFKREKQEKKDEKAA